MKNKSDTIFTIISIIILVLWLTIFGTFLILKLTDILKISWFWVWFCLWSPLIPIGIITIIGVLCAIRLGSDYDKYIGNKEEKSQDKEL